MSKPRYRWWGYVRQVLYAYPEIKAQYDALHTVGATGGIVVPSRGERAPRVTENVALRELPAQEQREYDAVTHVIDATGGLATGDARLAVVEMVFFRRTHTLQGAAGVVGYSYEQARNFQGGFIIDVARFMGLF